MLLDSTPVSLRRKNRPPHRISKSTPDHILCTGYAAVTFPGITEGVQYGKISDATEWVGKTSRAIVTAANILKT